MPLTRITGGQVKDQSITEDDLFLSDKLDWNVSIQRHGFCPKLPNNASLFLNGQGQWTSLPEIALPQNVYYVSPSFIQNSGQYWSNLKLLEQEINSLPPGREPLIIIYPGVYNWTGDLEFNRFVSLVSHGAVLGGTLKITQGAEIYVCKLAKCEIDSNNPVTIYAYDIGDLAFVGAHEVQHQMIANRILSLQTYGIVNSCNIVCNFIEETIFNGRNFNIYGANISRGLHAMQDCDMNLYNCKVLGDDFFAYGKMRLYSCYIHTMPISVDSSCRLALHDSFVNARGGGAIMAYGSQGGEVLLSNANLVCDGPYSIMYGLNIYIRGQSVSNHPRDPATTLMTPIDLIVDSNYENERYFY